MNIVAYCAGEFADSTRRAAGVVPYTSPPYTFWTFPPDGLERPDLLYLALHGEEWLPAMVGDGGTIALDASTIGRLPLRGTIVFSETCWTPESDLIPAFHEAGVLAVVGGSGPNWAYENALLGVNLLGFWFVHLLRWGLGPLWALRVAKARTVVRRGVNRADVMDFKVYYA